MTPQIVNTAGLVANIVGVVVALFYGYPQPSHDDGVSVGAERDTVLPNGRTVAEHDRDVLKRKMKYECYARTGLMLMGLGFFLQLVATWL